MQASSCVSLSNLFNMVSISLSPNNFFANCSATRSEVFAYHHRKTLLTESSSVDLFLRQGKYRNQLDHYLRDYIRHQWVQGDLGIDMETFEEVASALKEFKEGVIARAYSISRLRLLGYETDLVSE